MEEILYGERRFPNQGFMRPRFQNSGYNNQGFNNRGFNYQRGNYQGQGQQQYRNERPQQTVKLQQTDTPKADTISPSESAVDKLARLLNLDTSKSNLFEPIENINKTESKSIQKKELRFGI